MITIIGAGPAGLATAALLTKAKLPYRILERGRIGESWHHHYDRLHLHTLKQVSGLPGFPMPADYPSFPSRAQFLAYLEQYAAHFHIAIEPGITLESAHIVDQHWQLHTNHGPLQTEIVVMATGVWSTPAQPAITGASQFGGSIIHSKTYRNATPFQGQRVLVVGVGNSGSEIAVDLAEHGVECAVSVRSGAAFVAKPRSAWQMNLTAWLFRTLPRTIGAKLLRRRQFAQLGLPLPPGSPLDHMPVVGFGLPQAVAAGKIRVYSAIDHLTPGHVWFRDGQDARFDQIILATGYRPTLAPVAHLLRYDQRGRPLLDRYSRAVDHPTLVCVGYHYPTTEGWLQAIGRVAQTAVTGIQAYQQSRPTRWSQHARAH